MELKMNQELPSNASINEQSKNVITVVSQEDAMANILYERSVIINGRAVKWTIRRTRRPNLLPPFARLRDFVGAATSTIERPPGFQLVKVLEFICRKQTVERIIEPMHAEYLVEYFAALDAGRVWKAKYIKGQMRFYLVNAVVSEKVFGWIGKCFSFAFKAKADE
jgi:hypothetical protein